MNQTRIYIVLSLFLLLRADAPLCAAQAGFASAFRTNANKFLSSKLATRLYASGVTLGAWINAADKNRELDALRAQLRDPNSPEAQYVPLREQARRTYQPYLQKVVEKYPRMVEPKPMESFFTRAVRNWLQKNAQTPSITPQATLDRLSNPETPWPPKGLPTTPQLSPQPAVPKRSYEFQKLFSVPRSQWTTIRK